MRVLVTGGRGFVGSHLVEALAAAGHQAVALGRADGDLAEPGVAERLLDEHAPDAVVHLAGLIGWIACEQDPLEAIRQNAGVTVLVARACAVHGTRLAQGSTTNVYAPAGVYALTKRWGEEAALHFCPDAMLLRLAGPYGPGVPPGQGRGAIVNMLDQALRGEAIVVHRGAESSWCWIGDAVRGIVLLLEAGESGGCDIGSDETVSMLELARTACRLTGASEQLIDEVEPPAVSTPPHPLDTSKLLALGWRPEVDLQSGMRATLDWLRSREHLPSRAS